MDNIINRYDRLLTAPKDRMVASPRSFSTGSLADILKSVKGFGDKASVPNFVPLIGGTGLGELLMGKSPELMDDMSYNLSSGIRGGNRATGGLGTYTLDKRSADLGMTLADMVGLGYGTTKLAGKGLRTLVDKSGFDATRRAFMEGRGIGLGKPTNETVVDAASSVLSPVDEILQTPVSRRNVLKGAAAAGGLAATPVLLRNFVRDAEHVAPKAAAHVADNTAVSTVKHKYNSLAEYLDDTYNKVQGLGDDPSTINKAFRNKLIEDEAYYNGAKMQRDWLDDAFDDPQVMGLSQSNIDRLEAFSPKAKAEMKAYKESHLNNWGESPDGTGIGLQLPDYAPRWHEDIVHQLGQQGKKVEDLFDPYTEIPF